MSKWLNDDMFSKFVAERQADDKAVTTNDSYKNKWATPAAGTPEVPNTYVVRFLPDKKGLPYKKYYYHMFKVGDKFKFYLCNKTHNFENYCPICSASSKLWSGSDADKEIAKSLKRKEKFVANVFVVEDQRDLKAEKPEDKFAGRVLIYEFPSKIESKIKNELIDTKNGVGKAVFLPTSEGYDFILKVKSTKPINNQSWPDYSDSTFARKPSALGSDSEIDAIMGTRIDIIEYINSLASNESEMITSLSELFVYDVISAEYERRNSVNSAAQATVTSASKTIAVEEPRVTETTSDVISDDDLMNQLNDLDNF